MKKTILSAVAALIFLPSLVHAKDMTSYIADRVVEYRLPNGMKWLLLKRDGAPVFAGIIQVKAGGIDEETGKTGLAHLIEHMVFKGTKDISDDELWNAFVSNGAEDLNAFTSKDVTAYHVKMPINKLELWLYLASQMTGYPVTKDFYKERDVILEELRGSYENNPSRKMLVELLKTAFNKSPYGWPTIGSKEDLNNTKPEYLEAFRKKYYNAGRMTGSIVGNIDIERTKELICKYFCGMPSGAKIKNVFFKEDEQTETRRSSVKFDTSKMMMIGYHKPTVPAFDDFVFDVIDYILCTGDDSRLKSELLYKKKLVTAIDCDSSTPGARLDNLFLISTYPRKDRSYKDVESAIDHELEGLVSYGPYPSELKKTVNNLNKDFIFGLSTNEGIAESLVYFEAIAGGWRYMVKHAEMMEKITKEDVMNTAKKYLVDENKTVIELVR